MKQGQVTVAASLENLPADLPLDVVGEIVGAATLEQYVARAETVRRR